MDIGTGNRSFTAQFVSCSDGVSHVLAPAELSLAHWHCGQLALQREWQPTAAALPEPADSISPALAQALGFLSDYLSGGSLGEVSDQTRQCDPRIG